VLIPDSKPHALNQRPLDLAQGHDNPLRADLSTSGHPGLLWFELILSINPIQKQQVRSNLTASLIPSYLGYRL